MTKRPLCFLCFLMVLGLGIMNFAGIPLLGGNPLPVTVQDWIEAHPGSVICGEVEQYENTEFSQSVYLKKTYLIYRKKTNSWKRKNTRGCIKSIFEKRRRPETGNENSGKRNFKKSGGTLKSRWL